MQLKFIGTGSGETSLLREHSSILIDTDISRVLIDCGDGIPKALLKQGVSFNSIDAVIFTHYHADHFSGISPLITQMKLNDRKNELKIFTHANLVAPLNYYLNTCYNFQDTLGFKLTVIGFDFEQSYEVDDNFNFVPRKNSHVTNKHKVDAVPEEHFISSSFLLHVGGTRIIYTGDIGSKEDLFLFEEKNPMVFITETTHIDRDWIHGILAFYHPQYLFLTHISDGDEPKIEKHLRNQTFPASVSVLMAEDGQIVTLS